MNIFGPVPSRRLGRSLGINNIKPKNCTYSCVYCQIGRTSDMCLERREFYDCEELLAETAAKLKLLKARGEKTDYLTLVADGEPTLDENLGELTDGLRKFGVKIAMITNSSLLDKAVVREILMKYDLVSLKVDSALREIWKKVDRPHGLLDLGEIMRGMLDFADSYPNRLITETMLVKGVNDSEESLSATADFIKKLNPDRAYISVPIRPPAETWVAAPFEAELNKAFAIFSDRSLKAEIIAGYEGNEFSFTGDVREDILSITAVHPMKEEAVFEYLRRAKKEFSSITEMIDENLLVVTEYNEKKYYMRKLF